MGEKRKKYTHPEAKILPGVLLNSGQASMPGDGLITARVKRVRQSYNEGRGHIFEEGGAVNTDQILQPPVPAGDTITE